MFKARLVIAIFFIISFVVVNHAFALSSNLFGNVTIEINPSFPKPGQRALASVITNSLDLDRTEIIWLVNGSVVKQGTGEKSIGFDMGKTSTPTTIEVRINSQSLGQLSDKVTLTAGEVNILWESNTYTPTLYKGRALHSSESQITVLAVPNITVSGKKIAADSLLYTWKIDGNPMVEKSGFGKSSFSYMGPKIFGDDRIEVVVTTTDSKIYASDTLVIKTINPEIIFYEENELFGTNYSKVLASTFNMVTEELRLRAEPFYFTETDLNPTRTTYTWSFDGKEVKLNSDPRILTMRQTGGSGSSSVLMEMVNNRKLLQEASESFRVLFGNNL